MDSHLKREYFLRSSLLMSLQQVILMTIFGGLFIYVNFFYHSSILLSYIPVEGLFYLAWILGILTILSFVFFVSKLLVIYTTTYEITNETIDTKKGVFSQTYDFLELYRVKDLQLDFPFWMRLFNLGNIIVLSSDKTHPVLKIPGIKNVREIRNFLRNAVEEERRIKGVREFD